MTCDSNILLVNPPVLDFAAYDLFNKPLGLLYLAAGLRRAGYGVRLLDAMDRRHPAMVGRYGPPTVRANGSGRYHSQIIAKPRVLAEIPANYRWYGMPAELIAEQLVALHEQHRFAAVMVTSMMTYWYPGVARVIELIRRYLPGVPVALGGVYATLMPGHALGVCRPDRVFTGAVFGEVLDWLASLTGGPDRAGPGQGSGPPMSGGGDPENASGSGDENWLNWTPGYDLYERLDYLTLLSSVGCPFRCMYCASGRLQPSRKTVSPAGFERQLEQFLPLLRQDGEPKGYPVAFMDDALLAGADGHLIPILKRCEQLGLPLRFYCPNGLHARYVSGEVAEWFVRSRFSMVRLSYESADSSPQWQAASDYKVNDRVFQDAVSNLLAAGYQPWQLEAYVLAGLPGQSFAEIERSVAAVHELGVVVRLCQYSPIPGTDLFSRACRDFGIDPDEPLVHNNSIWPTLDRSVSRDRYQRFKNRVQELNRSVRPG